MNAESSLAATLCFYAVLAAWSGMSLWWLLKHDIIRPGSFLRAAARDGGAREPWHVPAAIWAIGVLAVFMAQMVGAAFMLGFPAWFGAKDTPQHNTMMNVAATVPSVLAGAAFMLFLRAMLNAQPTAANNLPRRAGLNAGARDIRTGLVGIMLALPLCYLAGSLAAWAAQLISGTPIDPVSHELLRELIDGPSNPWKWGLVGVAVVGAPVVEELLFRVFLQSALVGLFAWLFSSMAMRPAVDEPPAPRREPGAGRWTGIIATSVLFTMAHISAVATPGEGEHQVVWHALVPIFVLSMALGVAYERTGRWLVPMTMHAVFNAINVALAVFVVGA